MYYHDDPVYGLHVHPENSNVFLTASDDGKVLLWDNRNSCLNGMLTLSFIIYLFSKKISFLCLFNRLRSPQPFLHNLKDESKIIVCGYQREQ